MREGEVMPRTLGVGRATLARRVSLCLAMMTARCAALAALLVGATAGAAEPVPFPQLRDYMNRAQPCYVWAVGVVGNSGFAGFTTGEVFCIFDGVSGEGTIDERSGCMLAKYDVSTGYYDTEPLGVPVTATSKCSPKVVATFFENKSVSTQVINVLGNTIGASRIQIGGAEDAVKSFGRTLCKNVLGIDGLNCADYPEETEVKKVEAEPKKSKTKKAAPSPAPPKRK